MTLSEILRSRAESAPTAVAFADARSGQLTYEALHAEARQWRDRLQDHHLEPGEIVALKIADPLVFARNFIGLLAAGATVLPTDPETPAGAFTRHGLHRASLLVTEEAVQVVSPTQRLTPRGAGVLLSTSGTTGAPKSMHVSESQLLFVASRVADHHGLTAADVGYCPLPLHHINGEVVGLLSTLVSGARMILAKRFSRTGFWETIETEGVTWLNLVPPIIAILAAGEPPAKATARRIRFARSASAPLPVRTLEAFERNVGIGVLESYGMSEAASQICVNPLDPPLRRPGSVGKPEGFEIRIVDTERRVLPATSDGRVEVRGAALIDTYIQADGTERRAVDDEGWLATGDVGHLDGAGYLWLTGRVDDVINRGGEKMYPREIEEALDSAEGVLDIAVAAQQDPILGQCPAVYVVPSSSDLARINQNLQALARARLRRVMRPVRATFLERLPRSLNGKLSRAKLMGGEAGIALATFDWTESSNPGV